MDAAAPYSFDFEPVKDGRKIIAFKFTPLHYPQRENEDAEVRDLQRKLSLSWDIRDRHVRDYLKTPSDSPKLKSRTISRCSEGHRNCAGFTLELALLKGKSRDKNNPKGWIIRALEGKVKDLLEKIEKDGMSREILAIADKLGKK